MTMTPGLRKFVLTSHVTSSVGLLGAIAAFLALAIGGFISPDDQTVRATYLAMALIARWVIVPLAVAALVIGTVQTLATPWGLFRHYWVLLKFLLTTFATLILLVKMPLIGEAARLAAEMASSRADLQAVGIQLLVHSAGGLLVLLVPAALSVHKPPGLTRYSFRKQQALRARS